MKLVDVFVIIQRQQLKIYYLVCALSQIASIIFSVNWAGAGRVGNSTA